MAAPPRPPSPDGLADLDGVDGDFEEIDPSELDWHEKLGDGATAEVFRGHWRGKEVAIKKVLLNRTNDRTAKSVKQDISFARELSVLSKVSHPNLVQFHGVSFDGKPMRLVMEFCRGGNLFDLIHNAEDIELEIWQQFKMCTDIAEGMNYLHNFKPQIIHRDLKSLNLLLAEPVNSEKDPVMVKVSDFGTARMKDLDAEWEKMTKAAGTCHWMAPEVFKGKYNEMADVYSYAMVLYEIICREIPFEEKEGQEVVRLAVEGNRPCLEMVPEDCPPALAELMTACWEEDPKRRPKFDMIRERLAAMAPSVPPPP